MIRRPVVVIDGRLAQLPEGDTSPMGPLRITCVFDAGTDDLRVGAQVDAYLQESIELTSYTLLGDVAGDVVISIWADALANYPPTAADALGGVSPRLIGANRHTDGVLSSWTRNLPAGTTLRFTVESCAGIHRAQLTLTGVRT